MHAGLRTALLGGAARAASFGPLDLGAALFDLWDAERSQDIGRSGAAVTAWNSAKNGYAAVQTVGAARPLWSATALNGRPGVVFDGADDELTYPGVGVFPTGAAAGEIWALANQTSPGSSSQVRALFGYGDAVSQRRSIERTVVGGVNRIRATSSSAATGVVADFSGVHVVRLRANPTGFSVEVDGLTDASATQAPNTATARARIGALPSATASNFFEGVIGLIAVTAPLSDAQAAQMLAWLKARGGIG